MRELMSRVFDNATIQKVEAGVETLPIQKVKRIELFGGLKYVFHAHFVLILRMEYVYTTMLTTEKLVMMGSDVITNVYR